MNVIQQSTVEELANELPAQKINTRRETKHMSSPLLSIGPRSELALPSNTPEVINCATTRTYIAISIPETTDPHFSDPTTSSSQRATHPFSANEVENYTTHGSDKSSICHSPVWDNAETKQMKKVKRIAREERRKEKDKAEKEAKARAKADAKVSQRRLVKPAPTNRPSKITLDDRSKSSPAISEPFSKKNYYLKSKRASRKENNDIDYREQNHFQLGMKEELSPQNTRSSLSFQSINSIRHSDGFIGGMKLKMAQDATDGLPAKHVPPDENPNQDPDDDSTSSSAQKNSVSPMKERKRLKKMRNNEPYKETYISPKFDEAPHENVEVTETLKNTSSKQPSFMSWGIKRRHSAHSSITDYLSSKSVTGEVADRDRESINDGQSEIAGTQSKYDRVLKKAFKPPRKGNGSSERPPISYRAPAVLNARISRQQSQSSRSSRAADPQHETQDQGLDSQEAFSSGSNTIHDDSRKRSLSIHSLGRRIRSSSRSRSTTSDDTQTAIAKEGENHHEFDPNYTISEWQTSRASIASSIEQRLRRRKGLSHMNIASSLVSIKNVATSAFARHSHSSSLNGLVDQRTSKELSQTKARDLNDRVYSSGESLMEDSYTANSPSAHNKLALAAHILESHHSLVRISSQISDTSPYILPHHHGNRSFETSQAATALAAVEESIKPDTTTSSTTPASSRPQSQKVELLTVGSSRLSATEEVHHRASSLQQTETKCNDNKASLQQRSVPRNSPRNISPPESSSYTNSHDLNVSKGKELSRETYLAAEQFELAVAGKNPPPVSREHNNETPSKKRLQRARVSPLATPKIRFPKIDEPTEMANINPIAKMLVVCCTCRYFQDIPLKLYELMAKPDDIVQDTAKGISGVITTAVKCPWCGHGMSVKCCEGYAGVIYLRERLH